MARGSGCFVVTGSGEGSDERSMDIFGNDRFSKKNTIDLSKW
jgi:hypothetical protein